MNANPENEADIKPGDKVFVRRIDHTFPVIVQQRQGNWALCHGTGMNDYCTIHEWFPVRSKFCNISKVNP